MYTFDALFTGHGLLMWIQYVNLQHLRKRKLAGATQVLQVTHQRNLMALSFQSWWTALKCALTATSKAERMALHGRTKCVFLMRPNPTLFENIVNFCMKKIVSENCNLTCVRRPLTIVGWVIIVLMGRHGVGNSNVTQDSSLSFWCLWQVDRECADSVVSLFTCHVSYIKYTTSMMLHHAVRP